jgi:hypothetical protein
LTDARRRYSRHHAGGSHKRGRRFCFCRPARCKGRAEKKGVADGATKDANDAHDDPERSDTMKKTAPDAATMLSIAETMTLMEDGLGEIRTLLFRRKKQREKQRR